MLFVKWPKLPQLLPSIRFIFRDSYSHDSLCFISLGSLASSIFDPLKYLVGASGGVYALMGGYFMNVLVVRTLGMEPMDF